MLMISDVPRWNPREERANRSAKNAQDMDTLGIFSRNGTTKAWFTSLILLFYSVLKKHNDLV